MNQQQYSEHQVRTRTMGAYQPQVPFTGVIAPLSYIGVTVAELIFSGVRFAAALINAWSRRRNIRKNETALADLDDHILKDIGIPRDQIHYVARRAAEQPGLSDLRNLIQ
jgi:uncharacterized protein YjiS (DUF1127 family)